MTSARRSNSQCPVPTRAAASAADLAHVAPRFDAEPGVHIKLDKRGDGVAPVEGDTVQVNYSGRVKGKSQCRNATDLHAIDATEPTHRSMSTQARRPNSIKMTAATRSSSRSASGRSSLAGSLHYRSSASATTRRLP